MELWVAVILSSASVSVLGFLVFSVARGRFPESLVPFIEAFFGRKENAAVAADLGTKLSMASMLALLASLGCFTHYMWAKTELSDVANDRG